MLLLLLVVTSVALVPVFGGRPHSLADMRLRGIWLLLAALALQVALVLAPGPENTIRIAAYIGSYLAAGGFLVANRHISGLWLIGLGAALNFTVIVANGGVMPAALHAIVTSGLTADPGVYSNSIPLDAPQLALLGDIFAIPAAWPFSNVYSLGDICIALGAVVTVHRTTGSRMVPSGAGRFVSLANDRGVVLGAGGHLLSSAAGWTLAGLVLVRWADRANGVADLVGGAAVLVCVALLLLVVGSVVLTRPWATGVRPEALAGAAECARVVAILSLAVTARPSLLHLGLVAACLGATVPALRPADRTPPDPEQRVSEDAVRTAITGLAVLGALPLAATLVAAGPGFVAVLGVAPAIAGLLFVKLGGASDAPSVPAGPAVTGGDHVNENARRRSPVLIPVLVASAGLAAALPLQRAFAGHLLSAETQIPAALAALAFAAGVFGAGLALGAVATPALASRVLPERLVPLALAVLALLIPAAGTRALAGLFSASLLAGVALAVAGISMRSIHRRTTRTSSSESDLFLGATWAGGLLLGTILAALLSLRLDLPTVLVVGMMVVLISAFAADRELRLRLPRPEPSRPGTR